MTLQDRFCASPGSTWIGGRAPLSIGRPGPFRSEVVTWLDATTGNVLATRIVPPTAPDAVLAELLRTAIRDCRGAAPTRVRVAKPSDAVAVRQVLQGAVVELGPTPEVEHVARLITRKVRPRRGSSPTYLRGSRVTAEEMARFFEFMAALWEAAPWRFFGGERVLELDVPSLGVSGACVAVHSGAPGSGGIAVYETFDAFAQFLAIAAEAARNGDELTEPGVALLSLSYVRGADVPNSMRQEAALHGWVVANACAYPLLMPAAPNGRLRAVARRDLLLGCAAAAALVDLIRENERSLATGTEDRIATLVVLGADERTVATMRFPHSRAPEEAPEPRPSHRPGDPERDCVRRQANRRLDAFFRSAFARDQTDEWRDIAVFMIWMLHDFRLEFLDGKLEGLREWHVNVFPTHYVPGDVLADAVAVQLAPDVLDAYAAWLGAERLEPRSAVSRIRAGIRQARGVFEKKALDPAWFSPAKRSPSPRARRA